ncbi:MAG TPA: ABC transporter permease [Acidimicrobiales bacterium]|jgi:lipooligosaccharide transport system permease protein|nr:ABC transporter permease [Acidimicrobiales bacterium]
MHRIPALRVTGYMGRAYARTWRASIMTTFINPVLYLLAMGVGLGSFINKSAGHAAIGHQTYLHFVAPALAATAAATTAASESMFPIMGAIKWQKTYYAMLATPLRVGDVLAGHLAWIGVRIATSVASYLIVMAAFGTILSFQAVAILPVGILTGAAFATPLAAFAATQDTDSGFSLVFRLGVVPLFLFSGVFFPLKQLPVGLQVVAWITPLWNGVALCRPLAAGTVTATGLVGHLAYLIAVSVAGVVVARSTFRRRLLV